MEELDLKELFSIFWNKKTEIILITLIFMVIGVIYSFAFVTPEYKASTTLVLATSNDSKKATTNIDASTQTELTVNSKLVSTYSEIIKRKTVLNQVISNLNIKDLNEETLKNSIKVSSVSDTELIEISVVNKNASYASRIANEIAKVFSKKVAEIYNINNVYVLDEAELPNEPYNINHIKDIVIFAFVGIVLAFIKVLIANMLDNTIKTEQDVEKTSGLLVLAQIPEFDMNFRRGGKK